MSFFEELKRRNVFRVGVACSHEPDGPSMGRRHVATQTRGSAPLLRSPFRFAQARVDTSLCRGGEA